MEQPNEPERQAELGATNNAASAPVQRVVRLCDGCNVRDGHEHKCHSHGDAISLMIHGDRTHGVCDCEQAGCLLVVTDAWPITDRILSEVRLVRWFKNLFAERTPPKTLNDAVPSYRVTWTEIEAKMRELGWAGPVAMREQWAILFDERCRDWCNALLRWHDEKPLPRRTPQHMEQMRRITSA